MKILPQAYILVLRQLISMGSPVFFISCVAYLLKNHGGFHIPLWTIIIASLLSIPSYAIANGYLRLWLVKRRATQLGAVLPPFWFGRSIGSADLLALFMKSFHTGYLSEYLIS